MSRLSVSAFLLLMAVIALPLLVLAVAWLLGLV
jgi:hypothetical protein